MRSDAAEAPNELMFVVGHAVVVALALVTLGIGGFMIMDTGAKRDCPLGLEFERTESQVVEHRSFPPRTTCRYLYRNGDSDRSPTRVVTYDATGASIAVFVAVVCIITASVRLRRWTKEPGEAGSQ